ncbi:MAG: type III PLP-dependent enzyme [Candidatus Nanoarchaeia archaeon]|nr:type III PLP-dependent enzyme [Candidatus Nanoarchaeia archaeon]
MKKERYSFSVEEYMTKERFNKVKKLAKKNQTPFLAVNLSVIKEKYEELKSNMSFAKIYYAIKANPADEVIKLLFELGSNFDIASVYELDQILSLGITPERISFGNTIKKEKDIKYAFDKGIRLFATDSLSDMEKISRQAKGSKVFFRLISEGSGADWPLSRKFGAHPDKIYQLILKSKELGLEPYGLSFHVGSQQRDIGQWDESIAQCRYLFEAVNEKGIKLKMINMGGGFPGKYKNPTYDLPVYTKEITRFLKEDFPEGLPEIIIEPGRSIVADSGVIVSEIVLVSKKSYLSPYRWVYLDIGKFSGLIETLDESIKYPIYVEKSGSVSEVILAGPTCDSQDVLYENFKYKLPAKIKDKDKVYIFTTGAYTQTYSSVYFNGFPPLKMFVIE